MESGRDGKKILNKVFWILLMLKISWRDSPSDYRKWYMVYKRFFRWAKNGK